MVIPAIDLQGGRCVRLVEGRADTATVFGDDPVAMARRWAAAGAPRLHVVDLDGALGNQPSRLSLGLCEFKVDKQLANPDPIGW